ncbi:hypothetical protein [Vibrio coralliilyticus]|uniref:hypothetical protein n=1 Tax=Vibrio coralliilyticus TaxID=190893 RepID=UPI00179B0068|nr:hypothetical protein [Vibrio coralliilyticus]NUW70135.1 hypothetical protein [Vibrio coralliilyticus]
MFGFVSVLASTLSVFILILISITLGYINSLVPSFNILSIDDGYRYKVKNYYVSDSDLGVLADFIRSKKINMDAIWGLEIGCTYGFDAQKEQMENISVLNSINIYKMSENVVELKNAKLVEVEEDKNRINYCFIDIKLGGN